MALGRDTHTIRVDKRVREELIRGCSNPDGLREIFRLTWDLAFRRITPLEFTAFCRTLGCILWQPDDPTQRHVDVWIEDGINAPFKGLTHVCRVVWTMTHVTGDQEEGGLMSHEEILHSCGHNGSTSTAFGTCLNPACMVKGTAEARRTLKKTRTTLRRMGLKEVAVA